MGVELGLLSDPDPLGPISPPPLNLTAERFATLDGLLLLLVLHREAQDAAHLDRADGLTFALRQAAKLFADQFNYHDEARDTWVRPEEHTSELQSLMRISDTIFIIKKT